MAAPLRGAAPELRADLYVAGGGVGGMAAALAAADAGLDVLVTEPSAWLGGQLTAQAVPPDEHPWIEERGCTASYRSVRDAVRARYRAERPLTARARAVRHLNPGAGTVSALCCEPRVALAVLEALLAPHLASGRIRVLHRTVPVRAEVDRDRVLAVAVRDESGAERVVVGDWVVDATETGALLPLCGAEHVTGWESRDDTGEPHAPERARPGAMQPITVCVALEHLDGEDHTIARPPGYERLLAARPPGFPDGQLSLVAPEPRTNAPVRRTFTPHPPGDPLAVGPDLADPALDKELWTFRRIRARGLYEPGTYPSDVTLVNWPQVDYLDAAYLEGEPGAAAAEAGARELTLSFVHWLQTAAPRPDGGVGWPGLRPCGDVTGTVDGLAMTPYVREARRLRSEVVVREQDIAAEVRGSHGAVRFPDSVGIGAYRIDLHPSTDGDPYLDVACCPFQIPLGALLPVRLENLLAGGKALGVTHITNGAYRLHPVEWNVGEAAGRLAAFCVRERTTPRGVRADAARLSRLQDELVRTGVELAWPWGVTAY